MKANHPGAPSLLAQRLLALFFAGWALFDFPLLGLGLAAGSGPGTGADATLFGLPRLPLLLFAGWAGLIVALAWLMERAAPGADGADRARGVHGEPATGAGKAPR